MARLLGALDQELLAVTKKFLADGLRPDVDILWTALQRSNSSLKRKPKKVLQASFERVFDFLDIQDPNDSEAELELATPEPAPDVMNRALRENLRPAMTETENVPPVKRRQANGEPLAKRHKSEKATPVGPPTNISLRDLGGIGQVVRQLTELLVRPLLAPHVYQRMNVPISRGILLHGPPGCGKTMISRAFAAQMGLPFVEILGPSIVSGMSGESERGIRDRFEEAKKNAPCIIFLDEIDAIAPKRETSQSQMEKRIVTQLLVSMDELDRDVTKTVMVLATTNRPDALDPALRRGGRFGTEINIPVPNEQLRQQILKAQTRKASLAADVDLALLAKMTAGFVGADLHDLVAKAASWQLSKYFETLAVQARELATMDENLEMDDIDPDVVRAEQEISRLSRTDLPEPSGVEEKITMQAFLEVLPSITPSSKREGFATIPDVSWDNIGALQHVRAELQKAIVEPIKHGDLYAAVGITAPSGILLWGPPGCGKTLLAKAAAAESRANFISIKGPELLNKFVGESEAAVRKVFARARSSVPCVIFFDELDALAPKRDESGSEASSRIVNTLLTEMDGLSERQGIYVIAATNRPDIIDEAMLRPGRLETPLFVDLPGADERVEILRAVLKRKPVRPEEMDAVVKLAKACEGYSGADFEALARQAGYHAISRHSSVLAVEDFRYAMTVVHSSVGDIGKYYSLRERFAKKG